MWGNIAANFTEYQTILAKSDMQRTGRCAVA
jgi:hypothetical protein